MGKPPTKQKKQTCPFELGKCGEEGKNYKNLNIVRTKKAF